MKKSKYKSQTFYQILSTWTFILIINKVNWSPHCKANESVSLLCSDQLFDFSYYVYVLLENMADKFYFILSYPLFIAEIMLILLL